MRMQSMDVVPTEPRSTTCDREPEHKPLHKIARHRKMAWTTAALPVLVHHPGQPVKTARQVPTPSLHQHLLLPQWPCKRPLPPCTHTYVLSSPELQRKQHRCGPSLKNLNRRAVGTALNETCHNAHLCACGTLRGSLPRFRRTASPSKPLAAHRSCE